MVVDTSFHLNPVYLYMSVINHADFSHDSSTMIFTKVHLVYRGIHLLPVDKNPFLLKTIKDDKNVKTLPPNIIKIEQSSVIARVKNFLPVMAAANTQLESEISKTCPGEFDIENVKEDMQYVEMNIGVYEKSSDCSSDDNCDSDEEHICKMLGEVNETNIKITTENQNCGSKMITEIEKVRNKPSNSKKEKSFEK